jgi:hypothetical protein
MRAMVEHPFHTIKRLWGFTKLRYRGLAKNTARVFALVTLANLYRLQHRLLPQGIECRRARRFRPPWAASDLCKGHRERRAHAHQRLWAHADTHLSHTARNFYLIRVSLTALSIGLGGVEEVPDRSLLIFTSV